ncbi:hypothetical protein VNO78_05508 [Psophocarpus tetragonolobus]|uniref:Uncharacterized protein n=1 Tax=Psophocarpus tetragonolobus TaxID=3891 RepID=A0AAN9XRH1_PSOTE
MKRVEKKHKTERKEMLKTLVLGNVTALSFNTYLLEGVKEGSRFKQPGKHIHKVIVLKELLNKRLFFKLPSLEKLIPKEFLHFQNQYSQELLTEEPFHRSEMHQHSEGTQSQILHHEEVCSHVSLLAQAWGLLKEPKIPFSDSLV